MTTFWNTKFSKRTRNHECTNIVAIKADTLPICYDPKLWQANGVDVEEGMDGMMRLDIIWEGGQRHERYGYL